MQHGGIVTVAMISRDACKTSYITSFRKFESLFFAFMKVAKIYFHSPIIFKGGET